MILSPFSQHYMWQYAIYRWLLNNHLELHGSTCIDLFTTKCTICSWLNAVMWDSRYWRPTNNIKLFMDFQLSVGLVLLTPAVIKGQLYLFVFCPILPLAWTLHEKRGLFIFFSYLVLLTVIFTVARSAT